MPRASTRAYGPGAQNARPSPSQERLPSVEHNTPVRTPSRTPRKQKIQKRTAVGPWDFVKSVGAGSMGQVKLAVNRYTRQPAAVKIVPKAFTLQNSTESDEVRDARVIREAALGKLIMHPNIAQLYDVYSMSSHYYLVFEYISGGQLLDYIITHGSVSEIQARKFAREIASSLDYCHRNSIVHRDLKIENILISDKGSIKIIDFGLSNMFRRDDLLKTFCGSLYFAAPELLNAQPYVGPEIDVWSFGVVLYVLVCGKVPFEDKSMSALHSKIKLGHVEYPHWLSPLCQDLLSRMLVVPPAERASLREVIHHPWMNKGYDQVIVAHVPSRVPLQLPLDPRVIDEMSEMQLGEAQDIEFELKAVLSSHSYMDAVQHSTVDSYRHADPLNSFHPLISLYFLTRERLERLGQITPQKTLLSSPIPPQITVQIPEPETIPVAGATSSSPIVVGPPTAAPDPAPATTAAAPVTPIINSTTGGTFGGLSPTAAETPPTRATRLRSRTQGEEARPHGLGIVAETRVPTPPRPTTPGKMPSAHTGGLASPVTEDENRGGFTSLFRHISLRKRGDSRTASPAPRRNRNRSATTTHPAPPQLTVTTDSSQMSTLQPPANPHITSAMAGTAATAGNGASKTHNRAKSTSYTDRVQNDHSTADAPGMPSIIAPKQVFFKGFFSVQSTSNRPLVQLRADIIRVLTDLGIEFVEIKGGFSCIHGHAANSSALSPASPQVPPSRGHQRQISMGTPISSPRRDGASDGNYSSSNESFEMGGSDMLGHVPSNSTHSPVRFEISIVKVPVLSLHGVQFKKMGGNAWQYKTIAQEILERLHL